MTTPDEEDRWEEVERIGGAPTPGDWVFAGFAACARAACLFEMHARQYADNTTALRAVAFKDLGDVVKEIVKAVQARTTDAERAVLDRCVRVRNKLLHLELSRATGQLKALGADLDEGKVTMVTLADGAAVAVSQTSTANGRINGWLWEAQTSGAYARGVDLFHRGIALIGWLRAKDIAAALDALKDEGTN